MADEVDLAQGTEERILASGLAAAKKQEARDPNFCDCDEWKAGNFCGEPGCRDDYAKYQRMKAIRGANAP